MEFGRWLGMIKAAFLREAAHDLDLGTMVVFQVFRYIAQRQTTKTLVLAHSLQHISRMCAWRCMFGDPTSPYKFTHLRQNCSSSASASNSSVVDRLALREVSKLEQNASNTQGGLQ